MIFLFFFSKKKHYFCLLLYVTPAIAMKDRYINPLTDFGFKKLFGTEVNKDLLIDFLNQVLPQKIKTLSYSRNEQLGSTDLDRKAVFDLYCVGENEERFIVELQKAKQNYFKDRSVYYASFPIQEQAKKGDWDFKLEPVYSIGILDFIFDDHKEESEMLHTVELKDQHGKVFFKKLTFVYIELPKFKKKEEELETQFEKWLYVFRHLAELKDRPQKLQDKIFQRLFEAAEIAQFTPDEREAYEKSLKYYRDLKNVVDTSHEEGRLEGREEGRAEGLEEGIEKGRNEEEIEIAKKMILQGLENALIQSVTALSNEELEKLRQTL